MHRIDTLGNQEGRFFDGDPSVGKPPTLLNAAWFNAVQEEIASVIEGATIPLEKGKIQLAAAIEKTITSAVDALQKALAKAIVDAVAMEKAERQENIGQTALDIAQEMQFKHTSVLEKLSAEVKALQGAIADSATTLSLGFTRDLNALGNRLTNEATALSGKIQTLDNRTTQLSTTLTAAINKNAQKPASLAATERSPLQQLIQADHDALIALVQSHGG